MLYAMKLDRAEITGISIQENKTRGLGPKQYGKEIYLTKRSSSTNEKNLEYILQLHPASRGFNEFIVFETESF